MKTCDLRPYLLGVGLLLLTVPAGTVAQKSPGAGPIVVLETVKGVIEFETYPDEAPKTVARIVELARRLNGAIEMVTYTDVGPTRVYAFDMLFPIPNEMPQVALSLRAMAGAHPDSVLADAQERIVSPANYHP